MKNLFKQIVPALVLVLVGVAFFAGVRFGTDGVTQAPASVFAKSNSNPPENIDLSPLWDAWEVLNQRFVSTGSELPTPEDQLWGAIQGLTKTYGDPYTVFLPPQDNSLFEEDIAGNFGGVGMEIGIQDDVLTVIAPLKGTPAEGAGILAGDQVIAVDGIVTSGLAVDEAVSIIRGEVGTPVLLTIVREGVEESFDIEVIRGIIHIPTIDTELRSDGIFVISLFNFSLDADEAFREALRDFVISGSDKLIFDLRGNPGGFLQTSITISSWFLPTGEVVVIEEDGSGEQSSRRSRGFDLPSYYDFEMVVLVNGGSASASEIVAGALQEHGVGILMGSQTFGKGSVQELVSITDETSLKVTIARWLTPSGISISDGGLTPDVSVDLTLEDIALGSDPQLEAAVDYLLK